MSNNIRPITCAQNVRYTESPTRRTLAEIEYRKWLVEQKREAVKEVRKAYGWED